MANPLLLSFLFLLLGLAIGGLTAWLLAKLWLKGNSLTPGEIESRYVSRELFENLQTQADVAREDLMEREQEIRHLTGNLAAKSQQLAALEEKWQTRQTEILAQQEQARLEFENLANRLFEEKSRKFTDQNQLQINDLLNPLREKIKSFEEGIERRFVEETKDRVSLKTEIEQLRLLNQQLSADANNLASALKGENKTQGDWGEFQLELLLERAGLVRDVHFKVQTAFRDDEGKHKRPDFIIQLPEGKHLVVDSKVSLTAYEKYFNAGSPENQAQHLKRHVDSLRNHIRDLGSKNYQQLYQINAPDYLLLFVPIEPALGIALQQDPRLFLDALDQNIVLVTTSTLLATMRTVAFIWRQEKQSRSVLEIAKQSGLLYDKFVAFTEDLKSIGQRLDLAQAAYHDAMNKLSEGKRFGDTLVGRAEKIRQLGARTSKSLPAEWLDKEEEEENLQT